MAAKTIQTSVKSSSTKALNGAAPHAKETVHAADPGTFERAYARFQDAQDDVLACFQTPAWKRTLVAVVSGLIVACGVGYLGGTLLGWMMAGAVMAGASVFVALAVYVLGAIALAVAGGRIASRVAGAILTGEADERAIAAYDATRCFVSKLNPMRFIRPAAATVH